MRALKSARRITSTCFEKIPLGRFFLFSFESSESYRVFDYLHDPNSIFRAAGTNSGKVFGSMVTTITCLSSLQKDLMDIVDVRRSREGLLSVTEDRLGI